MRARFIFISALGIFFLALLIILSTDTACAASGQPGPCFLFPEGTDWYLGGRGYHNGCEGTNIQCGPIMGYDYIAPLGTPILAPFDGTVTASCHHDGVGNTVFKMVSSDGEWEFGSLHQECKVSGPVKVKAGQVVAYVDKIGMANGIPHSHAWFRNTRTGQNTSDHDQFWDCLGDGPPPPEPPPPGPPPEEKEWWEKIIDMIEEFLGGVDLSKIIEAIKNWFNSIHQPGEPPEPTPPETKVHKFSISAQKPSNEGYQHNVRAFFAWVTSGYDLGKMNEMDLNNFEGSWTLEGKERTTINAVFGTEKYEEGQGMVVPPGYKIGDGVCNAASITAFVMADAGVQVECDTPDHPPIPGVPQEWWCTVCIPSPTYGQCQVQDVHMANLGYEKVTLHWKVTGDTLSMWVETEKPPTGGGTKVDWFKIGIIIGVVFLIIFLVSRRKPELAGQALVWTLDHRKTVKGILHEAFKLAWSWFIVVISVAVIFTPQLREIVRLGFIKWIGGDTLIQNWQIAALLLAILANLLIRARVARKQPKPRKTALVQRPDGKVIEVIPHRRKRRWRWLWLAVAVLFIISPLDGDIPVVDAVALLVALFLFARGRGWKWLVILGVIITVAVLLFGGWFNAFNPSYVTYTGLYGHLGPGGWGSLSEYSTPEQAVEAVQKYASEVDAWNGSRLTVPVVNLVERNEDEATIEAVIKACLPVRCIVMLDISPQEDVLAIIEKWTWWNNVWFDVDLEHRQGRDITDLELNLWSAKYFTLRLSRGLYLPGVFAFYDFRSNPKIWPNKAVIWRYPNGIVVPIFDGHCQGEQSCKEVKYNATRLFLKNYEKAQEFGLMEFVTRWGCGSQYGDCGFTPQEYWQEFKPLIYLAQ